MELLKKNLFIVMQLLSIILGIAITAGVIWYVLPAIQQTAIGLWIASNIPSTAILYSLIGAGVLFLLFTCLSKFCFQYYPAKFKNFFLHLTAWLMTLSAIVISIYGFICGNVAINAFDLTALRKTGILVCFALLFFSHIAAGKIAKIVNRKIQSYQNAKEMNIVGRSSIIFANILKFVEILFPEIIVLVLISFCMSWNVAAYFIIILVASILPVIANIMSDFNTRREIILRARIKDEKFINDVAARVNRR